MKATLWVYDDHTRRHVATVEVPHALTPPDVIYWGYRVFVLHEGTEYREAVAVTVPVLPAVIPDQYRQHGPYLTTGGNSEGI